MEGGSGGGGGVGYSLTTYQTQRFLSSRLDMAPHPASPPISVIAVLSAGDTVWPM